MGELWVNEQSAAIASTSANGLFGPGIFATGIDLSALDEDTAYRLGLFMGEQLTAAEKHGYALAVSRVRSMATRHGPVLTPSIVADVLEGWDRAQS